MTTVRLPWPSRDLHPNARVHWSVRAKAAKKARHDGAAAALEAGIRHIEAEALHVRTVFYPPDNRPRDVDGMLSASKSQLDGIADVVGVDDSKWQISIQRGPMTPGGAVHVTIERI